MQIVYKALLTLLISPFLSSCNFPSGQSLPTPLPTGYIPTAVALTIVAQMTNSSPAVQPTETSTNAIEPISQLEVQKSATPNSTPTPSPSQTTPPPDQETPNPPPTSAPPPDVPFGTIQILNPGPVSRVISPFLLTAYLLPGESGRVQIELLGEDGRVLMREIKIYNSPPGARVTMGMDISFEIAAAAELGRIQVSTVDENGRTSALATADIILLSVGEADYNPAGDNFETIVIQQPAPNALIQGGTMRVSGLARPRSERPLMIELHTNEGKIVGTRQVAVEASDAGQYGNFAIDVPYNISAPTQVRLMVWEPGDHIPGIVHLSSLEVLLSP
ncbi:MAG TPA: Gmad2 immunoglobulin-like domain-containing protein [Anaerolineales bacterium]